MTFSRSLNILALAASLGQSVLSAPTSVTLSSIDVNPLRRSLLGPLSSSNTNSNAFVSTFNGCNSASGSLGSLIDRETATPGSTTVTTNPTTGTIGTGGAGGTIGSTSGTVGGTGGVTGTIGSTTGTTSPVTTGPTTGTIGSTTGTVGGLPSTGGVTGTVGSTTSSIGGLLGGLWVNIVVVPTLTQVARLLDNALPTLQQQGKCTDAALAETVYQSFAAFAFLQEKILVAITVSAWQWSESSKAAVRATLVHLQGAVNTLLPALFSYISSDLDRFHYSASLSGSYQGAIKSCS